MFQHLRKAADAARRQRLHWPGGNAIYADFFGAEVVSKIARACFETRLRRAHYVVMRHHFFRAVISHGENTSAVCHERRDFARKRDQWVSADIMRDPEACA